MFAVLECCGLLIDLPPSFSGDEDRKARRKNVRLLQTETSLKMISSHEFKEKNVRASVTLPPTDTEG